MLLLFNRGPFCDDVTYFLLPKGLFLKVTAVFDGNTLLH